MTEARRPAEEYLSDCSSPRVWPQDFSFLDLCFKFSVYGTIILWTLDEVVEGYFVWKIDTPIILTGD